MKKHRLMRKLVLEKETIARLNAHVLSDEEVRRVVGGSVALSCDGLRCSNDSACAATDTNPLCS